MKLTCLNCGCEFEGRIFKDRLGWHGVCPECKGSFDTEVPKGKIVMAFTDPVDDDNEPYKYFTEKFTGKGIHTYYAFDTPEEFVQKWKKIQGKPNGMWYWVMDNEKLICSGACDPDDIMIFENHWNI